MRAYSTVTEETPPAEKTRGRSDGAGRGTGRGTGRVADRLLVERAARGDPRAFEDLVRGHSGLVYRVALRMLGPARAPDASQEVWVKVWRNLGKFRGGSAFTTWLYRVAMNTCLTEWRREARRKDRELRGDETPLLPGPRGAGNDPESAALSRERRGEIEAALEHVRDDHRAALVLRHMEGLSYAEVAEVLDVPVGTAKGWAGRGRAAMLVAMNEAGDPAHPEG